MDACGWSGTHLCRTLTIYFLFLTRHIFNTQFESSRYRREKGEERDPCWGLCSAPPLQPHWFPVQSDTSCCQWLVPPPSLCPPRQPAKWNQLHLRTVFVAVSEKAHRFPFCAVYFLFFMNAWKHVTMYLWCTLVTSGNSFDQVAVIDGKLWNAVKRLERRFQFVAQRPRSAGLLLSRATLFVLNLTELGKSWLGVVRSQPKFKRADGGISGIIERIRVLCII